MADVFRGNTPVRVDEKGRLKLPADFKRLVDEQCGPKFYITSLDGKRAQLYPMQEWLMKEEVLAKLAPSHPQRLMFQKRTAYFGQPADMDNQGRLSIHPLLRDAANLNGEVIVLGMAGTTKPGYLEVVNHEFAKAEMQEQPVTMADMAAMADLGL